MGLSEQNAADNYEAHATGAPTPHDGVVTALLAVSQRLADLADAVRENTKAQGKR